MTVADLTSPAACINCGQQSSGRKHQESGQFTQPTSLQLGHLLSTLDQTRLPGRACAWQRVFEETWHARHADRDQSLTTTSCRRKHCAARDRQAGRGHGQETRRNFTKKGAKSERQIAWLRLRAPRREGGHGAQGKGELLRRQAAPRTWSCWLRWSDAVLRSAQRKSAIWPSAGRRPQLDPDPSLRPADHQAGRPRRGPAREMPEKRGVDQNEKNQLHPCKSVPCARLRAAKSHWKLASVKNVCCEPFHI